MRSAIFMLAGVLLIGSISISQCYRGDTEESDEMDFQRFEKRKGNHRIDLNRRGGHVGHGERRARMHDFIHKQLETNSDKFSEIRDNDKKVDDIFSYYQQTFERNYKGTEEKGRRRGAFKKRLLEIIKINQNSKMTHTAAVNEFSDLTDEEFNAQKKGNLRKPTMKLKRRLDNDDDNDDDVFSRFSHQQRRRYSASDLFNKYIDARSINRKAARRHQLHQARQISQPIDWVSGGRVTSVKDQMTCGDCYAFATMAVLEALGQQQSGNLVDFSPQEVTDCSGANGNNGCDGGCIQSSIDYLNSIGGSVSSWDQYNYTSSVGNCLITTVPAPYSFGTISYTQIPSGDENQLYQALTQNPVYVGINADTSIFSSYESGVINMAEADCPASGIDHAVTLVGYGNDPVTGLNYWKIKNSWGTSWGEDGYVRIAQGTNVCGIASDAVSVTVS